jgi:hypothetical protein
VIRAGLLVVLVAGCWAEEPAAVPAVPPEVLAAAAVAGQPLPPAPSPAALAAADQIDVLLLTADTLLAKQSTVAAGDRFVAAVKAMEEISRSDRQALGERYREQRRHLSLMAQRLLADPAVATALGSEPLVPTPDEQAAAVAKPQESQTEPAPTGGAQPAVIKP